MISYMARYGSVGVWSPGRAWHPAMTQVSGNSTRGKPAKAIASYIQTA